MARGGHRYHLILYSYILNRFWKPVLWSGILLLVLVLGSIQLPLWLPQYHFFQLSDLAFWVASVAGLLAMGGAILILMMRKAAYVRPMQSHLRVVTPLLKMNIAYKRIRRASTMEVQRIFPPERFKGWKRRFLQPLAGQTVVVLDMNGWPLSPGVMKLFLSPFFFPDKTPRLAFLIPRWMDFSTELESFRGAWLESQRKPAHTPQSDLLSSFSTHKR